ncbi:MAG: substrate-binding domain-containing protein, partial [Deltaproteobacteria bacterium]|nr:substrate-binding domain-containing protein [Deltaproteobacteria bacterium]
MQRTMAFLMVLWLMLSGTYLLNGCQQSSSTRTATGDGALINVLLVPKFTGNAFFDSANLGAQDYAAKNGFTVEYLGSPVPEVSQQLSIIDEAIKSGAKALVISSLDGKAMDESLKRAIKSGMTVVTFDTDVSSDARNLTVSQGTPAQLGAMLVEMAAKSLRQRLQARRSNPAAITVKYAWHYSESTSRDENAWFLAGEEYIRENFPNWVNVAPDNYYSQRDPEKAIEVGRQIFKDHPDIDVIICSDFTALPGQAQAAKDLGLTANEVTITGFATPNSMRDFCLTNIIDRWGLWDCRDQAALACYLAWYLASGQSLRVGQKVNIPEFGVVEILNNSVLDPHSPQPNSLGVVLLSRRLEFTRN